jgi:hypothetical protein
MVNKSSRSLLKMRRKSLRIESVVAPAVNVPECRYKHIYDWFVLFLHTMLYATKNVVFVNLTTPRP